MSETVDLKKKSKEVDAVDLTMFDDPSSQINFISMVLGKEHGWEATIYDPQTRPDDGPDRMPHVQSTLEKAGYATHLKRGKDVHELRVRNIGTRESFMASVHELGLVKGIGHTIKMLPEKIHHAIGGMKKFAKAIMENPQRAIGFWYLGGDAFYAFTGFFDKTRSKEKMGFFEQFDKPIVWRKNFAGYCFGVMSVILLAFGKEGREVVMDDLMKGYNKMLAEGHDLSGINWEEATKSSNPVRGFMEKYSLNIASALMLAGKVLTIDSAAYRLDYETKMQAMRESDDYLGLPVESANPDEMTRSKYEDAYKEKLSKKDAISRGEGIDKVSAAWREHADLRAEFAKYKQEDVAAALEKQKVIEKLTKMKEDKEGKEKKPSKSLLAMASAGEKKAVEIDIPTLNAEEQAIVDLHSRMAMLEGVALEVAGPASSALGWGLTMLGMGGRAANAMISASSVLSWWGGVKIQNPMQIMGESIYLMGDAFLWATGERKFGGEVAKATAAYLRVKAPYVLSHDGENEVIKHTARRYAEEELKAESKDKNFKPTEEQIHEKAVGFEKLITDELTHIPSRFDRVVAQAASIVSQFPEAEGMRDKALANMLEFIKGASVTVKAEEAQFAEAIKEKVTTMQGREVNKGRSGSKYITVKDLAGDAAALMDAIPGSKYAANVVKLHELLIDAGARPVENGPSRIAQTHRDQVINEAKAQGTKFNVTPQMQTAGVSPA